jgi:beta-lactam-binding protein with PASTA domain
VRLGGSLERRRGRRRRTSGAPGASEGGGFHVGRRLLATLGGVIVAGWLLGYVVSTRLVFPAPAPPSDLYAVPDVRGIGLASARERLAGVGLAMGPVDSLQHPSVAEGLILGQSPLPGQLARADSPVRVTVSLGPQTRSVPDVLALEAERARTVLETSGFRVSVDTMESEVERGRVIEVFPPPDSVIPLPSEVRLVVSTGPPVVVMPFVLGMTEEEARMLLDSLGLVVAEVEPVFRFGRDQGIVVQQEPASDMELVRGSSVRLQVGRGGSGGGNNEPREP